MINGALAGLAGVTGVSGRFQLVKNLLKKNILFINLGYANPYYILITGSVNAFITFYVSIGMKTKTNIDDVLDVFCLQAVPGLNL